MVAGEPPLTLAITTFWNLTTLKTLPEVCCQQLAEMYIQLIKMRPAVVNRRGPVLLQRNARADVANMSLQMLTELGYDTRLCHITISMDLSPTEYTFLKLHYD